jgi:hypothetical protein
MSMEDRMEALRAEMTAIKNRPLRLDAVVDGADGTDGTSKALDEMAARLAAKDRADGTLARTLAAATCHRCGRQGVTENGVCQSCLVEDEMAARLARTEARNVEIAAEDALAAVQKPCPKCGESMRTADGHIGHKASCPTVQAAVDDNRAAALRFAADGLKFAAASFHDVNQWRAAKALDDMQRQVLVMLELHGRVEK